MHNDMTPQEQRDTLPHQNQLIAWPRIAAISAMVAFSLPTFITGIEVAQSLSIPDALLAMLIGCLILTLIGGAMGTIGVQTRMSSYQLVRIAFGDKGAAAINLAFALSLLGWFGVNIDLFSGAVNVLFQQYQMDVLPSFAIELIAGTLMTVTTVIGFSAINRIASWMVPVIALVTLYMLYSALQLLPLADFLNVPGENKIAISQGVSAIVGAIIIGAIILPDITRFSRHQHGAWHTAFWSYLVVQLLVMIVAAWAGAATNSHEILQLMLAIGLGVMAFAIVICGSWILNSLNLYSTCLSVAATWPKAQNHLNTALLGITGIVAASFNILEVFIQFLVILSAIFVPVAGVIMVDYFLLYRGDYQALTLAQKIPFSPAAAIAWISGAGLAITDMFVTLPTVTGINVLDAILLCALVYWTTSKRFLAVKPPPGNTAN